jgi:hypothetical protein
MHEHEVSCGQDKWLAALKATLKLLLQQSRLAKAAIGIECDDIIPANYW